MAFLPPTRQVTCDLRCDVTMLLLPSSYKCYSFEAWKVDRDLSDDDVEGGLDCGDNVKVFQLFSLTFQ